MKFSADYRALALDALRGRWKTAVLAGLIASLLSANIVSSSDRVISNMSQNANGDTPGFAGLLSTGSGGVLAVLVVCILAWAVFTVIVGGAVRLFCLDLSFLGWELLCTLPMLIGFSLVFAFTHSADTVLVLPILLSIPLSAGFFFLHPYEEAAWAIFYRDITAAPSDTEEI